MDEIILTDETILINFTPVISGKQIIKLTEGKIIFNSNFEEPDISFRWWH